MSWKRKGHWGALQNEAAYWLADDRRHKQLSQAAPAHDCLSHETRVSRWLPRISDRVALEFHFLIQNTGILTPNPNAYTLNLGLGLILIIILSSRKPWLFKFWAHILQSLNPEFQNEIQIMRLNPHHGVRLIPKIFDMRVFLQVMHRSDISSLSAGTGVHVTSTVQ